MAGVGGCVGNDDGGDAGSGEDAGGFVDEGLAKEAGIAADEHAVGLGLSFDVGGDAGDGATDVGDGEFVGDDGAPAGGAELERGRHDREFSLACTVMVPTRAGTASCVWDRLLIFIGMDWDGWAVGRAGGMSDILRFVVLMRLLMIGLLVSVGALVVASRRGGASHLAAETQVELAGPE